MSNIYYYFSFKTTNKKERDISLLFYIRIYLVLSTLIPQRWQ